MDICSFYTFKTWHIVLLKVAYSTAKAMLWEVKSIALRFLVRFCLSIYYNYTLSA